jgi:hypothetical protein
LDSLRHNLLGTPKSFEGHWDPIQITEPMRQWFVRLGETNLDTVLKFESSVDASGNVQFGPQQEPRFFCDQCEAGFHDTSRLATHRWSSHSLRSSRTQLISSPQCIRCGQHFATTRYAQRHFHNRLCQHSPPVPSYDTILDDIHGEVETVKPSNKTRTRRRLYTNKQPSMLRQQQLDPPLPAPVRAPVNGKVTGLDKFFNKRSQRSGDIASKEAQEHPNTWTECQRQGTQQTTLTAQHGAG